MDDLFRRLLVGCGILIVAFVPVIIFSWLRMRRHLSRASPKAGLRRTADGRVIGDGIVVGDIAQIEDEGTTPLRYPSIETRSAFAPGSYLELEVDLLRQPEEQWQGPLSFGPLPADWDELELAVLVSCAAIDWDNDARGKVTMRRNADSTAATLTGRVKPDAQPGPIAVLANFFLNTRFCGSAVRIFALAAATEAPAPPSPPKTLGTVSADPNAEEPDLTIHIFTVDPNYPGRLHWQVVTARFDGLPPKLDATIDLGQHPSLEAAALFTKFAELERGKHGTRIESFGSELWQLAPQMFRDVYWAIWDHHKRALKIQFISDEPHLPWELMRPVRADETEIHPPLLLKHPVARWIKRWDGYMRNRIPSGRIFTIAPKYQPASRQLPRAQTEAQLLVDEFGAERVAGTRQAVDKLLQNLPVASDQVAILHFAGHGAFSPDAATDANIKLEDGDMSASEVARPEVKLGKAYHTLVFFNACEVGATGRVFGQVGGWADALLSRQFGGFIAPLWSVDDEDASVVATELLDRVWRHHQPVGEVLRALREKHCDTSPTFYSYLYYGDVTAQVRA